MRFGILAPMPSELRPVVKAFGLRRGRTGDLEGHVGTVGAAEVVATTTGIGIERGAAATRRLLDGADIHHVVVVGIAGGVGPVAIRDLVVPEVVSDWPDRTPHVPAPLGRLDPRGEIVSSDVFGHPSETIAAFVESGVVAVDMETAAVAAVCGERGVPWSAVRAISDRGDDGSGDTDALALVTPEGKPRYGTALWQLARHPGRVRPFVTWARDATAAANAAARAAAAACREASEAR